MSDTPVVSKYPMPHWEIDCSAFSKALDIIEAFPQGGAVFVSLELVESEEDTPYLALYATNRDYVYEAMFSVTNSDVFPFDRKVYIKFPLLRSLVKTFPDFVFVMDKGELCFHNDFAHHVLKPLLFDGQYFPAVDYSKAAFKPFPLTRTVLSSVRKLFDFAVRLVDNKVQWKGHQLYGNFLTYAFNITLPEEVKSATQFRKFDMSLLAALSNIVKDLEYAVVGDRFVVRGPGCALSFLRMSGGSEYKSSLKKEAYGELVFDLEYLGKVLSFVKAEPTLQSLVFLPKDGNIYVRVNVVNTFYVGHGTIPGYGFSLRIEELRHIISTFPDGIGEVACIIYGDGAEFRIIYEGVSYTFTLAKLDTTQTSTGNSEVIDRLSAQREAAKEKEQGGKK